MATKEKVAFGGGLHKNTGCFIDGAYGEEHAVQVMAGLLQRVMRATGDEEANELLVEYDDDLDPEDFGEWLDDATDVLQNNTADGLVWEWEAGDLCLMDEDDDGD
jgi:hypothetical protein